MLRRGLQYLSGVLVAPVVVGVSYRAGLDATRAGLVLAALVAAAAAAVAAWSDTPDAVRVATAGFAAAVGAGVAVQWLVFAGLDEWASVVLWAVAVGAVGVAVAALAPADR